MASLFLFSLKTDYLNLNLKKLVLYLPYHAMNTKKVAPKNKVNKIKNNTYNCCISLIPTPVGISETRNAIENIAIVKQMLNNISKNFVSISYCDGMLFNRIF